MCRLCAITDTEHLDTRLYIMDRMHLLSQLDAYQDDGFGITNGAQILKTSLAYADVVPNYLWDERFIAAPVVMSHLRKASASTGRTDKEAHPYHFKVRGSPFICAHNGYIAGTGNHSYKPDIPDTDSWRAFDDLADIVEETGTLGGKEIEQWLTPYLSTSQLAILIMWNDVLYAFRHDKPLHTADIGNGVIIHTSQAILERTRGFVFNTYGINFDSDISLIPENTLIKFGSNSTVYEGVSVNFQPAPFRQTTYGTGFYNQHTKTETEEAKKETAALATVPVTARPAISVGAKEVWKALSGVSNPMRNRLFLDWLVSAMGLKVDHTVTNLNEFVAQLPVEDVCLFLEMIGKWSPRQRQLLDTWNKLINAGSDTFVHYKIFGEEWFWLDHRYISSGISDKHAVEQFLEDVATELCDKNLLEYCRNASIITDIIMGTT